MNNPVKQNYAPHFDPLVHDTPGTNQDYAPTYWVANAPDVPEDDGPVYQDMEVDVAIIGGGFTGLACAIYLAEEHGIKAHVLEANQTSWGCSSRNGGQALYNTGRLNRAQWIKKWGKGIALELHREVNDAYTRFKDLISDIDCDATENGHLYVAHNPKIMGPLGDEMELLDKTFGYKTTLIDKDNLQSNYINEKTAHGALWEPAGIALHPVKLAYGYHQKARTLGVKIHTASPVEKWATEGTTHYLKTPNGIVKAKAVAVATGGYTTQKIHPILRNKVMPILSNNMVTRPLNKDEMAACGVKEKIMMTDTRILRHYYRFLPDGRLQIGSRSAITGADASNPVHLKRLIENMEDKFPALKGIDIDYSWWGWVDVSHDMMPRICQPNPDESIYYAIGYGGNGVMYSAQAGKRMADLIAGKAPLKHLPIFKDALPDEFFAPFRRIGQRVLYRWYGVSDVLF